MMLARIKVLVIFCLVFSGCLPCFSETYSYTFKSSGSYGRGEMMLEGVKWVLASDAALYKTESDGMHFGKSKEAVSYVSLSTDEIPGVIQKITVNARGASGTTAKLDVTVDGKAFGDSKNLTGSAANYTFEGVARGKIEIRLSQSSATKALYLKSVTVVYETFTGDKYVKVTDAGTLCDGDELIIVCEEAGKAMNNDLSGTNAGAAIITLSGGTAYLNSDVQVLTLEGSTGAWYLKAGAEYLYASSSTRNELNTSAEKNDNAKADIQIVSGNAKIVFQGTNTINMLRYNGSGTGLFSCYSASSTLPAVQIYRKTSSLPLVDIASLKALATGGEARLSLDNVQVLWREEVSLPSGTAVYHYVRDASEALVIITPDAADAPSWQSGDLLDGYIEGIRTVNDGNGDPIEALTMNNGSAFALKKSSGNRFDPIEIAPQDAVTYAYNYVKIIDQPVTVQTVGDGEPVAATVQVSTLPISDRFRLGDVYDYITLPYQGAYVDVVGIIGYGTADTEAVLQPLNIGQPSASPYTYVFDQRRENVAPDNDITNANVRMVRTVFTGWNTFCVPFDLTASQTASLGVVKRFSEIGMAGDNYVYNFTSNEVIEAGIPYLLNNETGTDIVNPQFSGEANTVTLRARSAQDVAQTATDGVSFSYVGVYSPAALSGDGTVLFLSSDGTRLVKPDASGGKLNGFRAYFRRPSAAVGGSGDASEARISIDGEDLSVPTGIVLAGEEQPDDVVMYNLHGQRVQCGKRPLPSGVYIRDGKKILIR